MKKFLLPVFAGLLLFSCGSKEELDKNDLTQEEIESLDESSLINSDEINYEGTFKGKIQGKDVQLELNGESFELTENGKRAHGNWSKIDDGTIIELEPKGGSVSIKNYQWSDNDTWVAMSGKDSLTYLEPEQYLKRIPD